MPSPFHMSDRSLPIGGVAFAMLIAFASVPAMSAETVLYSFKGGRDGIAPQAGVIADATGILYGTTAGGGGGTDCKYGDDGCGTVFELAPDGAETVLHAFAGGCDGAFPFAGLVADKTGNFYGTTTAGGICNNDEGFGTIFKIAPDGTESVVYAFSNGTDGSNPAWNLVIDKKGNLYGPSEGGGQDQCCGVVFKVTPKGKLTILHTFAGGNDGAGPSALIMDKAGILYGAAGGGGGSGCGGGGCGTVFELAPDGTETTLYAFQDGNDGERPIGG